MGSEKLIDSYEVTADNVTAKVSIWRKKDEKVPIYEIIVPVLGEATSKVVDKYLKKMSKIAPLEIDAITDLNKIEEIKNKFRDGIIKLLKEEIFEDEDEEKIKIISGIILHKLFGFDYIDLILADNFLEEFAINSSNEHLVVYHKKYGWCKTNKKVSSEEGTLNLSAQIARKTGTEINYLRPILDTHLLTGDRVASTLFPVSTMGHTITIRRFARMPWTPVKYLDPEVHTLSEEIAAFLWLATEFELNVLIAGGTASGKTSMLNSVSAFIPPNQRIISIEDTREINLPQNLYWNWVPMKSKSENTEGKGKITMLDLLIASLRMRPDRIIVGEVRRKEQAEAMFEAMNTGHSVYTTMHADTAEQVKRRLLEPPIEIPQLEVESLQLIVVQYRDRITGKRRTLEVAELLRGSNLGALELNYLYRWNPRKDTFEKVNDSVRVVEDLNLHTGMTPQEINEDLHEKEEVLKWMNKYKIREIDEFGSVMQMYYTDKKKLVEHIKNGGGKEILYPELKKVDKKLTYRVGATNEKSSKKSKKEKPK